MIKKKILSIHILYYNRAHNLIELTLSLLPIAKEKNIIIKVFDDCSDVDLSKQFKLFKIFYKKIFYIRNKNNIGHDQNYLQSIKKFQSKYLWVIGDSYVLNQSNFGKLFLQLKNNNYDFGILNIGERLEKKLKINKNIYTLLLSFTWHVTLLGSLIYNKKATNFLNFFQLKKIKNFPQIYIFFNLIIKKKNFFYFKLTPLVPLKKESYWLKNTFKTFLYDFPNVFNLFYFKKNLHLRNKIVSSHLIKSKIISLRSLFFISLKQNIMISYFQYNKYLYRYFFKFLIIFLIPKFLKKIIINLFNLKSFINESWKKN
jgi:hypothetical protein